jgi:hypothetical protein
MTRLTTQSALAPYRSSLLLGMTPYGLDAQGEPRLSARRRSSSIPAAELSIVKD